MPRNVLDLTERTRVWQALVGAGYFNTETGDWNAGRTPEAALDALNFTFNGEFSVTDNNIHGVLLAMSPEYAARAKQAKVQRKVEKARAKAEKAARKAERAGLEPYRLYGEQVFMTEATYAALTPKIRAAAEYIAAAAHRLDVSLRPELPAPRT